MTVPLKLTDEQAKWLKKHLALEIENAHWAQEGTLRDDSLEHAQTIHKKLDEELKNQEW